MFEPMTEAAQAHRSAPLPARHVGRDEADEEAHGMWNEEMRAVDDGTGAVREQQQAVMQLQPVLSSCR